jgi:hypothetical protein
VAAGYVTFVHFYRVTVCFIRASGGIQLFARNCVNGTVLGDVRGTVGWECATFSKVVVLGR